MQHCTGSSPHRHSRSQVTPRTCNFPAKHAHWIESRHLSGQMQEVVDVLPLNVQPLRAAILRLSAPQVHQYNWSTEVATRRQECLVPLSLSFWVPFAGIEGGVREPLRHSELPVTTMTVFAVSALSCGEASPCKKRVAECASHSAKTVRTLN